MDSQDNIREIINLAKAGEAKVITITDPDTGEDFPVILTPKGGGGVEINSVWELAAEWREHPLRIKGVETTHTLEHFIDLFNRHKSEDSVVFAKFMYEPGSPRTLIGVIDYHGGIYPDFCEHRIKYEFPASPESVAWRAKNGMMLNQSDFAEFIEDHIHNIATVDAEELILAEMFHTSWAKPTDLLELSRGLALSAEVNVKEVRNLANGSAQIVYEETHKDGAGQPLIVPGLFIVQIPLFAGGKDVRLVARLRYKRTAQGIKWSYHMWRWEEAVRGTLLGALAEVREKTGALCLEGEPAKDG